MNPVSLLPHLVQMNEMCMILLLWKSYLWERSHTNLVMKSNVIITKQCGRKAQANGTKGRWQTCFQECILCLWVLNFRNQMLSAFHPSLWMSVWLRLKSCKISSPNQISCGYHVLVHPNHACVMAQEQTHWFAQSSLMKIHLQPPPAIKQFYCVPLITEMFTNSAYLQK